MAQPGPPMSMAEAEQRATGDETVRLNDHGNANVDAKSNKLSENNTSLGSDSIKSNNPLKPHAATREMTKPGEDYEGSLVPPSADVGGMQSSSSQHQQEGDGAKKRNTSFKITNILPSRPPSNDPEESGEDDVDDSRTEDISDNIDPVSQPNHVAPAATTTNSSNLATEKQEKVTAPSNTTPATTNLEGKPGPSKPPSVGVRRNSSTKSTTHQPLVPSSNMKAQDPPAISYRFNIFVYHSKQSSGNEHLRTPASQVKASAAAAYVATIEQEELPNPAADGGDSSTSSSTCKLKHGPRDRFKVVKIQTATALSIGRWTLVDYSNRSGPTAPLPPAFVSNSSPAMSMTKLPLKSALKSGTRTVLDTPKVSTPTGNLPAHAHSLGVAAIGRESSQQPNPHYAPAAATVSDFSNVPLTNPDSRLQSIPDHVDPKPQGAINNVKNAPQVVPQQLTATAAAAASLQQSPQILKDQNQVTSTMVQSNIITAQQQQAPPQSQSYQVPHQSSDSQIQHSTLSSSTSGAAIPPQNRVNLPASSSSAVKSVQGLSSSTASMQMPLTSYINSPTVQEQIQQQPSYPSIPQQNPAATPVLATAAELQGQQDKVSKSQKPGITVQKVPAMMPLGVEEVVSQVDKSQDMTGVQRQVSVSQQPSQQILLQSSQPSGNPPVSQTSVSIMGGAQVSYSQGSMVAAYPLPPSSQQQPQLQGDQQVQYIAAAQQSHQQKPHPVNDTQQPYVSVVGALQISASGNNSVPHSRDPQQYITSSHQQNSIPGQHQPQMIPPQMTAAIPSVSTSAEPHIDDQQEMFLRAAATDGVTPVAGELLVERLEEIKHQSFYDGDPDPDSASGTNQGAIDNRIEQAMDLVKSHLMSAVRGEVEELKEKIQCLEDKISCLQSENELLRASVPQEVLLQISTNQPAMITGGNPVPALTSIMSSSAASTTASVTSGAISASSDTSASTPNPSNPPPAASTSSSTPSQVAPAPTHQGQQPPPQGSASGSNQTQPSSSSQALPTPPTS